MRVRHPDDDDYVSILGRDKVPVDDDGTFPVPDDVAEQFLETWCERNGYDREDVLADDGPATCEVVKNDGEVCGRELPCPYHSEGEE